MRLLQTVVASVLAIFFVVASASAARAGETLTMDAAVAAALDANPELAAYVHAADAARARPPQAATPPDPMFMVDFMNVPTNTADVSKGTVMYMVEQQVPFPSKLVYGYKAEKRAAEAAFSDQAAQAQEVVRNVKLAYLDVWRLEEEERIERETLSIYSQSKGSAEESYATLKGTVADPVRASVHLGEVEARLAVIDQERIDAVANLSRVMASELDPSIRVASPPPIPQVAGLEGLLERARLARPEIESAQKMSESEGARLSFAKSQYGPDLSLRWGFMDNPSGNPNGWYGRAGITVPLWSLSKQRFGVRESKAMLERARSMKEAAELKTESQVKSAHARLMAAQKSARIYSATVLPRARLLVASSREAYAAGKGDFLGVVDSIRSLNNAELMLVRAKADAVKAYAELERAVGASPARE